MSICLSSKDHPENRLYIDPEDYTIHQVATFCHKSGTTFDASVAGILSERDSMLHQEITDFVDPTCPTLGRNKTTY